jgi:hypothetical protein
MKVQISESQLKRIISEQLSTGVQSGTYEPTVKYKGQNDQTIVPKPNWPNVPKKPKPIVGPEVCLKSFNQETLNQAIKWWTDWLNDPKTFNKFKSNWGYPNYKALDVFKKYFNLLDPGYLTIEFLNDRSNVGGSAGETMSDKYITPIFVDKHDRVISVNKMYCGQYDPEEAVSLLVHELQHFLYDVHPFHPDEKVSKDFGSAKKSLYNTKDINYYRNATPIVIDIINGSDKLLEQRFDELLKDGLKSLFKNSYYRKELKDKIIKSVLSFKDNSETTQSLIYLGRETEIYSRLTNARQFLNLKPGDSLTPEEVNYVLTDCHNGGCLNFIENIILCEKPLNEILKIINSYAIEHPEKSKIFNPDNKIKIDTPQKSSDSTKTSV